MILSAPVRGARVANQGLTSAASWLLALAPAACITRGSPKGCRSEPSPVPSPGLAFVCPLYEPPIRRGVRGLPDTLPQVRRERLFQPSACSHNSAKPRGRQYQKPCCISQGVMAALPRRAEFQTLQSNGGLLCTWCKGSCRRSFVAPVPRQQPSAAYDWLSVPGLFQGSYCRIWQNSSVQVATRTMLVISNGDLLCSDNMGSCRRSFDAKVRRKQSFATNRWLLSFGPFHGSRCRAWQDHAVKLTTLNVHMISNGGLLCSGNTGWCRRSFDAPVRRKLHLATCCWLTLFGPFQRSRCRLCRLFLATDDQDCVWSVHRQFRSESSGTCHRPLWVAASWPAQVKRLFPTTLWFCLST